MKVFFIISLFFLPQKDPYYCNIYGTFYEVESPSQADIVVYEELSESSADLIVYEETNRLYADRKGIWFFEKEKSFARYTVFFTKRPDNADFKVFFTEYESFVGCNR